MSTGARLPEARSDLRARILHQCGARGGVVTELLEYDRCRLVPDRIGEQPSLPLVDEPHLEAWRKYADLAKEQGTWAVLGTRLVQLGFPVAAGMSRDPAYLAATRRGELPRAGFSAGLGLRFPERLRLDVHPINRRRRPGCLHS